MDHAVGTAAREIAAAISQTAETPATRPNHMELAGIACATPILGLLLGWLSMRCSTRAWSGIEFKVTRAIIGDLSLAARSVLWLACTEVTAADLSNFAAAIAFAGMIAHSGQSPRALGTSRNHCQALIASRANLGHCRVLTFGAKTGFRCLPARSFYRTIRQETSLLKPGRSPLAAGAELMVPEYVRSNSGSNSLASEAGETHFNRGCLRIDCPPLPPRIRRSRATRYAGSCPFVEGLPTRIEIQSPSFPSRISLIPVDERPGTATLFRAELQQHALSRAELIASRVVFVAASDEHFPWATNLFGSFAASLPNPIRRRQRPDSDELIDYFRLEETHRSGHPTMLDAGDFHELERLRTRLGDPRSQRLFDIWRTSGEQAVVRYLDEIESPRPPRTAAFLTRRLPRRSDIFQPGGAAKRSQIRARGRKSFVSRFSGPFSVPVSGVCSRNSPFRKEVRKRSRRAGAMGGARGRAGATPGVVRLRRPHTLFALSVPSGGSARGSLPPVPPC